MNTNTRIDCIVGIFDTEYSYVQHQDGSITVKVPYLKWDNNSGNLSFNKYFVDGSRIERVKKYFEKDVLVLNGSTLDDVLYNNV